MTESRMRCRAAFSIVNIIWRRGWTAYTIPRSRRQPYHSTTVPAQVVPPRSRTDRDTRYGHTCGVDAPTHAVALCHESYSTRNLAIGGAVSGDYD